MPLQVIPHMFSSIQLWQMLNPQRHCQQKETVFRQQWQVLGRLRHLLRYDRLAGGFDIVACSPGRAAAGTGAYRPIGFSAAGSCRGSVPALSFDRSGVITLMHVATRLHQGKAVY